MWLFWIFCLFQYIIAVPLGLVCSGIQNEDIMSIIPSSLSSSSINDTLNDFYMVTFLIHFFLSHKEKELMR